MPVRIRAWSKKIALKRVDYGYGGWGKEEARRTGSGCIYNCEVLGGREFRSLPICWRYIAQQPPLRWGLLFDMIQIFFKQSASISGAKTCVCSQFVYSIHWPEKAVRCWSPAMFIPPVCSLDNYLTIRAHRYSPRVYNTSSISWVTKRRWSR